MACFKTCNKNYKTSTLCSTVSNWLSELLPAKIQIWICISLFFVECAKKQKKNKKFYLSDNFSKRTLKKNNLEEPDENLYIKTNIIYRKKLWETTYVKNSPKTANLKKKYLNSSLY